MAALLIAVIYIAFISLGLPDSLLGSAWPVMQAQMEAPLSYAGVVSMIIAGGTIFSSLFSDRLTRKLGAGKLTAFSVLTTAAALWGFSVSSEFWMLCLWAVPYGLGAGSVDAALNNYVALNYSSRHMNFLHGMWGVGAAISPYVMSYCLTGGFGWQAGYRSIAIAQIALTAILFVSLPLWKRKSAEAAVQSGRTKSLAEVLRLHGVAFMLIAFCGLCGVEAVAGLWSASFLAIHRGVSAETAASYTALFYIGITAGRFISGLVSEKIGDRNMIRIGLGVIILGIIAVWLPIENNWLCLNGLVIIGVGCAPVYPAIIHSTPGNFGEDNSQAVIGVQMAAAYTGSTFMPPLFGLVADYIGIWLYPAFLSLCALLTLVMSEALNQKIRNPKIDLK